MSSFTFLKMCYVYVYVHASHHASALRDGKKTSELLELKLPQVVSSPVWLLGTESRSSRRAVIARNHQAISPALITLTVGSFKISHIHLKSISHVTRRIDSLTQIGSCLSHSFSLTILQCSLSPIIKSEPLGLTERAHSLLPIPRHRPSQNISMTQPELVIIA